MQLAPPKHRAYTYTVTTPPTFDLGAELLPEFKLHAQIIHSLQDELLTMYLNACIEYAEKITRRVIAQKGFTTYRDFFPSYTNEGYYRCGVPTGNGSQYSTGNLGFEIRRSPLVSVTSITYRQANTATGTIVDPLIYYNTLETDFSEVLTADDNEWPSDASNRMQAIAIEFIAGITDSAENLPACWKVAIFEHAMAMYTNRGDCGTCDCASSVPAGSKSFYALKQLKLL